ncbi:uncharacterized protein LOC130998210 [Salvia miltiorrhiza]|uniref:uncharacterized protein LOC130998210 n=1 Tax=Salvia miltiorrhiza TaxID=226208 RepID=UPI0025ABAF63|nr:uncharacterized protein LOC130998210 [Salvia miltiorrhiza]
MTVMSTNLGVSKSLIHKWVKEKKLKPHTNAIKPFLTPQNRLSRLKWSLNKLSSITEDGFIKFQSMYNTIHIDEKWFYRTKTNDRYYILPNEEEPYRTCKSKRYIEKIMFMCAVARPIFGLDGRCIFDGKFGIFPFTTMEATQRNSKNRMKGTMEVKPITAATKEVMKCCLLKEPANSPDTNVNDLGFFRAIQTLKDQKPAGNVEELLKNVKDAYDEYPPEKLNHVFITLQSCYHEIIKARGGNDYKIPHMNKERLSRLGLLPDCIQVEETLVRETLQFLELDASAEGEIYNLGAVIEGLEQVDITE